MSIGSLFSKVKQNRKSGVAVSIISVPLSISLALASGATPLQGIITAVFAGIFAAAFGGSNYNIVGPTGALSGLVLAFAVQFGANSLPLLAVFTGILVLAVYLLRLTKYITLIPSTALHGFILGVAIILTTGQLNNALGLVGLEKHESILLNFLETLENIGSTNLISVIVFVIALAMLLAFKKYIKAIPGILPVSVLGIAVGRAAKSGRIPREMLTLSDQFPDLTFQLIAPNYIGTTIVQFRSQIELINEIAFAGFAIAIVAILETIISAKIADKMTKTKFHQQKEVLGLALANIASGLAGGIPATAALVRTNLNVKSGANSRVSAIISSCSIILISWILFGSFKYIPLAVMAALLINIAIGMVDIKTYKKIYKYDRRSLMIMIVVGIVTFLQDPIYGIIIGTAASLLIHLKHSCDGDLSTTLFRNGEYRGKMTLKKYLKEQKSGDIIVCKFSGEIDFMNINEEIEHLKKLESGTTIILSFSEITYMDIDGIETFDEVIAFFEENNLNLYFSGIHGRLERIMNRTEFYHDFKAKGRVFETSSKALTHLGVDRKHKD